MPGTRDHFRCLAETLLVEPHPDGNHTTNEHRYKVHLRNRSDLTVVDFEAYYETFKPSVYECFFFCYHHNSRTKWKSISTVKNDEHIDNMFSDYLLSMETITPEMIIDYVGYHLSFEAKNNKDNLKDFRAGLHYEVRE